MIIVKTKNGDRFINDAETLQVSHVKDKAQVEVWPSRWGNQQQQPQYFVIEHVESVIYTNDAQPMEWKDEGSEIQRLKATIEKKDKEYDQMLEHSLFMREWFSIYQNAFYDIKNAAVRSKNGSKCEDMVIDALIEQAEKKYAESQKRFEKVREKWDKKEKEGKP